MVTKSKISWKWMKGIQMVATVVNVQVKNEEKIETAPKKVVFDTKT